MNYSAFKTPIKIISSNEQLMNDYKLGRTITLPSIKPSPKFNLKKEKQQHFLPIVSTSPNTFQADIAEFGKYKYLVAIGVNNRYGFAVSLNNEEPFQQSRIGQSPFTAFKDVRSVLKAYDTLIKIIRIRTREKIFLETDAESAFKSKTLDDFFKRNDVEISAEVDTFHTRLAIVNRFIRTLRDMAFVKFEATEINPEQMNELVKEYNNSFHLGLSKVLGFTITPLQVISDRELEAKIMRTRLAEFFEMTEKNELSSGTQVIVHSDVLPNPIFKKRRQTTIAGEWKVVGKVGNRYQIIDEESGKQMIVPRWGLKLP
jgi:hypothetical protein